MATKNHDNVVSEEEIVALAVVVAEEEEEEEVVEVAADLDVVHVAVRTEKEGMVSSSNPHLNANIHIIISRWMSF